jgi:hypothetical protein
MRNLFSIFLFSFLLSIPVYSQGTLQFNQALIITNQNQTVPAGKVWKITSVYGTDRICIPCILSEHLNNSNCTGRFVDYTGASFQVNSVRIFSERKWFPDQVNFETIYSDAACTNQWTTTTSFGWGLFNIAPNPNLLPMWIPAGTTVQTDTPNIFLSVLEFNILP